MQIVPSGFSGAVAVTPNDSTDLARGATKSIYIGGAGTVKVDMANGDTVTFTAMTIGSIHQLSVRRVYSTGTSATLIVALY